MAVAALAWTVFVPPGVFWTGVLAGGLLGAALATAGLAHRRGTPSLARLIATADPERRLPVARHRFEVGVRARVARNGARP